MKKTLLFIFIVSLFITALFCINTSANGSTTTVGNLTFTEYDTYCAVTKCDPSATGSIEIPSSVDFNGTYLPVGSINSSSFIDCDKITSVTIPKSIMSIGTSVFNYCTQLTGVYIEDIVKWCTIDFSTAQSNPLYYAHNLYLKNELVSDLIIPDGVASINNYAFSYCRSITSVTIPDSVNVISKNAFSNCYNLASATIGNGVTSIGSSAFAYCNSLRDVTIPDSVVSIDSFAFSGCDSLKFTEYGNALYLGNTSNPYYALIFGKNSSINSVTVNENTIIIANSAFANYRNLTSVTIGGCVTKIDDNVFNSCRNLKNVILPDSVTSINSAAFNGCTSIVYNEYDNALYLGNTNNPYHALIKTKNKSITGVEINELTNVIADGAFTNCTSLTSVTIPDSIISIGDSAFSSCNSLTNIVIPNNITKIGYGVFYNCRSLENVSMPNTLTAIGDQSFYGCYKLANITIPDTVTSIGYFAFYSCGLTSVTIPDSVKSIDSCAFYECRNLRSVTIGNGVTSIGNLVFWNCSNLKNVYLTDIVNWCNIDFYSEGSNPFYYANNLYLNNELVTSLILPDDVTSISRYAFYGCQNLTSVVIPDSVTSIGDFAFNGCYNITILNIGSGVSTIGKFAFGNCGNFQRIIVSAKNVIYHSKGNCIIEKKSKRLVTGCKNSVIPNDGSVTSIGDGAFFGYSGLTSVTIPDSVTIIGKEAFSGCSKLTSAIIGNGVMSIGDNAFYACINLTNVMIPDSVTSIGDYAFQNCSRLTSVTIPDSVTSIGDYAFQSCVNLTSVTIGDGVTSIGERAFQGCGFTIITIPDNVTSIGDYSFANCSSLTRVTIGNGVTSIGDNAFCYCNNLTNVIIGNGVKFIGNNAFSNCSNLTYNEYDNALYLGNMNNPYQALIIVKDTTIASISINESTNVIADYAFNGCNGLTSVYITDIAKWCEVYFSTEQSNPLYYAHNLYLDNEIISDLVIPEGVLSINDYTFSSCNSITSVIMPDSVISIGNHVFSDCNNLSYNEYDDALYLGNTENPYYALIKLNDNRITEIVINEKTKVIAGGAFFGCSSLENIIIPDSVISIGNATFSGCSCLKNAIIGNSVMLIGDFAFQLCGNLINVTIGNSVTSIGNSAFGYDSKLVFNESNDALYLGNSDNLYYALIKAKDAKITSVIINDGVKIIADYAFNRCSTLNRVKYTGTPVQWNEVTIGSNNNPLLNATIGYKTTLSATADIGNISIEPSGELFTHDEIKLKADNLLNYSFIGWFDGDNKVSESPVYTFEITGDTVLTAKFEAVTAPVTVTVNCENGAEYTVTNNTSGGNDIFVGDSITIAAKDASKVLQWQNASGKVLGRGGSLTITVGGDTEITLIYKAEGAGQAYVQFVSGSGQVFSAGLYGSEDPISFPVVPTKLGYSFDGWVIDGTDTEATEDNIKSLFSSNKSLTVKPSYTELTTEFTVTVKYSGVNREDVVSSERIGSGFSVEAPEISGFVFQNWTDETGKILSYKNNYYVQVSKDITLIAVYGDEAPVALPVITISGISKVDENGTHKMTASATRSIPDGYELVEHGVLYARDVDGLDETTFVYGTPGVSKYISNKTMQNGVVKLNVKVDNDDVVVSMRGYMILKKNGVLSIYYTDIVSGKYGA